MKMDLQASELMSKKIFEARESTVEEKPRGNCYTSL